MMSMICFPAAALKENMFLECGNILSLKKNEEWRLPLGATQVLLGLNFKDVN